MSLPAHPNLVAEAIRIIESGKAEGIPVRLMGAVAVIVHSPSCAHLSEKLSRALTDIDLMSYGKYKNKMDDFFAKMGYEPRKTVQAIFGSLPRRIYDSKTYSLFIDVFFDNLNMCHLIDFRGRLESDYPTIPLAELLLEKMQIVKINEKDIKDTIILFLEHDIGDSDKDMLNGSHIAKILSQDWGFYYTVTINLKKVMDFATAYKDSGLVEEGDVSTVHKRIKYLLDLIENEPKSWGWKMRAKVGPKKKWYQDVEELYR